MINIEKVEEIKGVIGSMLRTYNKNSIVTSIQGYYQGSAYDETKNVLKVAIGVEAKHVLGGKELVETDKREIRIQFKKDYKNVKQKDFDNLLNQMVITEKKDNSFIILNKNEKYYDIVYNIFRFYYVDLKDNTKRKSEEIKEQIKTIKGTTVETKNGYKVYLHDLTIGGDGGIIILEGNDDNYKLKLYHNGRVVTLIVKGDKIKLETGEYRRLPNGSQKAKQILLNRYLKGKDIQEGLQLNNKSYMRALNKINMIDVEFDTSDNDIYQNSNGSLFRIEITDAKSKRAVGKIITFHYLTRDRQGTPTNRYYLDTIFNGEFKNLDLWTSEPEWFIDSHVLSDIYEDHIEGVYGKNGYIGNI